MTSVPSASTTLPTPSGAGMAATNAPSAGGVERPHLDLDRGAASTGARTQPRLGRRGVERVQPVLGRGGRGRAQDRAEVGELVVERLAGEVRADDRQTVRLEPRSRFRQRSAHPTKRAAEREQVGVAADRAR